MSTPQSYYNIEYRGDFENKKGEGLPVISNNLDSIRTYQWEIHFLGLPPQVTNERDFTLAAKQVSQIGFQVEDIEVNRVNDKVFYPGRPSPDEITITFDNLYLRETASDLWRWFKTVYDPLTGEMTKNAQPAANVSPFKANKVELVQLDNASTPHAVAELYGVYPKSWKLAEFNYSTNEFHTIEVSLRYDFLDQFNV
jgi:hypothetical protein